MRRVLAGIAWVVLFAAVVAAAYVGYLFAGTNRIADGLPSDVRTGASGALKTGTEYQLVSWNLGFGAFSDDFSFFMDGGEYARAHSRDAVLENMRAMIERLSEIDADFLLLQEVDVDSDRSHHVDQRALLVDAFPDRSAVFALNYDSAYLFYPPTQPIGRSRSGVLTLARAEIAESTRRSLPVEGGLSKFLDLDRCYTVSRIPVDSGKEFLVYNLHLSAYTAGGAIAGEQLGMLLDDMRAEYLRGNYAVAAGDFNKDLHGGATLLPGASAEGLSWTQPFPIDLLPAEIALIAPEGAPSCRNADAPYLPGETLVVTIDGFLITENVKMLSAEVLDEQFRRTDHNPVLLRFRLTDA